MINIFVANLDFGITSEDLQATFSQFGAVTYAHVVYDNKTKKSKGYGYVEMENSSEAIAAIQALNGMDVGGRALDIKIATPKDQRVKKEDTFKPKPGFKKAYPSRNNDNNTSNYTPKTNTGTAAEGKRVLRSRRKRSDEE
ncbi:MAG TPA: RNA-binding protein [Brumimicrobium sp.]|nr:RNA-binding protein [Brumimicrobium sp.]